MSLDLGALVMLMYHPAFDVNHCLYRILGILSNTKEFEISWSLLRILDFYYLFPSELKKIKPWPREISEYKKIAAEIPEPFEDISNSKRIFHDLEHFQKTAILELIAKGIISKDLFAMGKVRLDDFLSPNQYLSKISGDTFFSTPAFKIITKALPVLELNGSSGLKSALG